MRKARFVRGAAVAVVGLMAITTLMVPASAHVNSPLTFKHLKKHFYTKGQLKNPGAINASSNPVNWTKLNGVPAELADGTDALGVAVAGFRNGPFDINDPADLNAADGKVGTLAIPAGTWVIFAKLFITDVTSTGAVPCRLAAAGDFDDASLETTGAVTGSGSTLSMQLVHTFAAPGSAIVTCDDEQGVSAVTKGNFLKVTAIQLSSVTNTAIT